MLTGVCVYFMIGIATMLWLDRIAPCPNWQTGTIAAIFWPLVIARLIQRSRDDD